ncbi:MAG: AAA family ATPase [Dehalococcoidales bacterium]|nr:AAA family ATPase [Dehalococcoidales bacterium]
MWIDASEPEVGRTAPGSTVGAGERPYASSREHLLDELGRIDLTLRAHIQRLVGRAGGQDDFRGLYVSHDEVADLVRAPLPGDEPSQGTESPEGLLALAAKIRRRRAESTRVELRLDTLTHLFGLTPFDVDTLLLCLAPNLDLRYERLYAYLQDDVTKKRPSVDLALKVLYPDLESRLAARSRFTPEAPLLQHHLLELFEQPAHSHPSLLGYFLRLDERISSYLLDQDDLDERLLSFCRLLQPAGELSADSATVEISRKLASVLAAGVEPPRLVCLHGPEGMDKLGAAARVCAERRQPLLVVDGNGLLSGQGEAGTLVELVFREASLRGGAVAFVDYEAIVATAGPPWPRLLDLASERQFTTFLVGAEPWEPGAEAVAAVPLGVPMPLPDTDGRCELWRAVLAPDELPAEDDLKGLAAKFRFGARQVANAHASARNRALWRDPAQPRVDLDDLYAACRAQSSRRVGAVAQKVRIVHDWDDLVLPEDQLATLREICDQARYRDVVYETWGFGQKQSLGRGLIVLFAGPSGTGKTLAAEILAGELGLDLYKIDLATVVSKYIGETEKNLDRVFREAENCNAVLFFDEADALFGKRSEVRDSHDRYANIEIAYLLQKMEEYDGTAILATNLRQNLDDAFVRRMHFVIEFPFPEEDHRFRIWRRAFPALTPLGADADLKFLARQFKVPGGNIRNIALAASFLAAAEGRPVHMEHLIWATKREFQKMGKLIVATDFKQYYELVKGS